MTDDPQREGAPAAPEEPALRELWAAQAELSRDPEDFAAWHRVAVGLSALGDGAAAARALGELGDAAADAGFLPLALLCAKDLETVQPAAARARVGRLAQAFGRGSERIDPKARQTPPGRPGQAEPGPLPDRAEVLESARKAAVFAAAHARRQRSGGPVPPVPLFSALAPEAFEALCGLLVPRWLRAGDVVIEQGAPGSSIFIIARGVVRIERELRPGERSRPRDAQRGGTDPPPGGTRLRRLAILRAGAFFGEMALLFAPRRTARAVCDSDSVLFEVERAGLEALGARTPELGQVLADFCRRRLLENLVESSPLFAALPEAERSALMARFALRQSAVGEALLREGSEGQGLHVLVTGAAVVQKLDGTEVLRLAELGPGDAVGEISLLRERTATATVTATLPTVTLFLAREDFEQVARSHPAVVGAVYALAAERERHLAAALEAETTPAEDFLV